MYWDSNDQGTDIPDDFEVHAEQQFPWVFFEGPHESLIVSHDSGPVVGVTRQLGRVFSEGVRALVRPIGSRKIRELQPVSFHTIGLKEFLKAYPHGRARSPHCLDNPVSGKTADWFEGARFCESCRDRLSLISALEQSPAVRVVPLTRHV